MKDEDSKSEGSKFTFDTGDQSNSSAKTQSSHLSLSSQQSQESEDWDADFLSSGESSSISGCRDLEEDINCDTHSDSHIDLGKYSHNLDDWDDLDFEFDEGLKFQEKSLVNSAIQTSRSTLTSSLSSFSIQNTQSIVTSGDELDKDFEQGFDDFFEDDSLETETTGISDVKSNGSLNSNDSSGSDWGISDEEGDANSVAASVFNLREMLTTDSETPKEITERTLKENLFKPGKKRFPPTPFYSADIFAGMSKTSFSDSEDEYQWIKSLPVRATQRMDDWLLGNDIQLRRKRARDKLFDYVNTSESERFSENWNRHYYDYCEKLYYNGDFSALFVTIKQHFKDLKEAPEDVSRSANIVSFHILEIAARIWRDHESSGPGYEHIRESFEEMILVLNQKCPSLKIATYILELEARSSAFECAMSKVVDVLEDLCRLYELVALVESSDSISSPLKLSEKEKELFKSCAQLGSCNNLSLPLQVTKEYIIVNILSDIQLILSGLSPLTFHTFEFEADTVSNISFSDACMHLIGNSTHRNEDLLKAQYLSMPCRSMIRCKAALALGQHYIYEYASQEDNDNETASDAESLLFECLWLFANLPSIGHTQAPIISEIGYTILRLYAQLVLSGPKYKLGIAAAEAALQIEKMCHLVVDSFELKRLATVCGKHNDPDRAITYFSQVIAQLKAAQKTNEVVHILIVLGGILIDCGDFRSAECCFYDAIRVFSADDGYKGPKGSSLTSIKMKLTSLYSTGWNLDKGIDIVENLLQSPIPFYSKVKLQLHLLLNDMLRSKCWLLEANEVLGTRRRPTPPSYVRQRSTHDSGKEIHSSVNNQYEASYSSPVFDKALSNLAWRERTNSSLPNFNTEHSIAFESSRYDHRLVIDSLGKTKGMTPRLYFQYWNNRARTHYHSKDYADALFSFDQALAYCEVSNLSSVAMIFYRKGKVMLKLLNPSTSLTFPVILQRGNKAKRKSRKIFRNKNELTKSCVDCFLRAQKKFKAVGDEFGVAKTFHRLCLVDLEHCFVPVCLLGYPSIDFFQEDQIEQAEIYAQKALDLASQMFSIFFLMNCYLDLAEIRLLLNDVDLSRKCWTTCRNLFLDLFGTGSEVIISDYATPSQKKKLYSIAKRLIKYLFCCPRDVVNENLYLIDMYLKIQLSSDLEKQSKSRLNFYHPPEGSFLLSQNSSQSNSGPADLRDLKRDNLETSTRRNRSYSEREGKSDRGVTFSLHGIRKLQNNPQIPECSELFPRSVSQTNATLQSQWYDNTDDDHANDHDGHKTSNMDKPVHDVWQQGQTSYEKLFSQTADKVWARLHCMQSNYRSFSNGEFALRVLKNRNTQALSEAMSDLINLREQNNYIDIYFENSSTFKTPEPLNKARSRVSCPNFTRSFPGTPGERNDFDSHLVLSKLKSKSFEEMLLYEPGLLRLCYILHVEDLVITYAPKSGEKDVMRFGGRSFLESNNQKQEGKVFVKIFLNNSPKIFCGLSVPMEAKVSQINEFLLGKINDTLSGTETISIFEMSDLFMKPFENTKKTTTPLELLYWLVPNAGSNYVPVDFSSPLTMIFDQNIINNCSTIEPLILRLSIKKERCEKTIPDEMSYIIKRSPSTTSQRQMQQQYLHQDDVDFCSDNVRWLFGGNFSKDQGRYHSCYVHAELKKVIESYFLLAKESEDQIPEVEKNIGIEYMLEIFSKTISIIPKKKLSNPPIRSARHSRQASTGSRISNFFNNFLAPAPIEEQPQSANAKEVFHPLLLIGSREMHVFPWANFLAHKDDQVEHSLSLTAVVTHKKHNKLKKSRRPVPSNSGSPLITNLLETMNSKNGDALPNHTDSINDAGNGTGSPGGSNNPIHRRISMKDFAGAPVFFALSWADERTSLTAMRGNGHVRATKAFSDLWNLFGDPNVQNISTKNNIRRMTITKPRPISSSFDSTPSILNDLLHQSPRSSSSDDTSIDLNVIKTQSSPSVSVPVLESTSLTDYDNLGCTTTLASEVHSSTHKFKKRNTKRNKTMAKGNDGLYDRLLCSGLPYECLLKNGKKANSHKRNINKYLHFIDCSHLSPTKQYLHTAIQDHTSINQIPVLILSFSDLVDPNFWIIDSISREAYPGKNLCLLFVPHQSAKKVFRLLTKQYELQIRDLRNGTLRVFPKTFLLDATHTIRNELKIPISLFYPPN